MSSFLLLVQDLHRECNCGGTAPTALASVTGTNLRLKNWILQADQEIKSRWFNWNFLWAQATGNTVAAAATITPPTAMNVIDGDSVLINSSYVSVMEYQTFRARYLDSTVANNIPSIVTRLPSGALKMHPTPNAIYAYSFDYWKKPTEGAMSVDADLSLIPAAYHAAILYVAMGYYALWDNAPELKQHANEMLYGRDPGVGDQGWMRKLEAAELPSMGMHGLASGNFFEVTAQ